MNENISKTSVYMAYYFIQFSWWKDILNKREKLFRGNVKRGKKCLLKGSVSPVLNLSKILDVLFVYTFHS